MAKNTTANAEAPTIEKLDPKADGSSLDILGQNIETMRSLFPEVFTEGSDDDGPRWKVDIEKLGELLGEHVEEKPERFSFNWHGKSRARRIAQAPSTGTLRPCPEESVDWETTKNIFIEGDNLEVLKLLQKSYHCQVKMIYIDPPYNTGNEFIYPDKFQDNLDTYLRYTGQVGEDGLKFSTNTDSSGRYHTNWLNMMYPRLKLAKNLLCEDGMIFISIDDGEQANLKKICDEVFGEENYVNTISVNAKVSAGASGGGEDKRLKKNIEYVLMYMKNFSVAKPINPIYKETRLTDFIQIMKLDGKSFKYTNVLYRQDDIQPFATIKDGDGNDIIVNKVNDYEIKTIKQIAKEENISEEAVYEKYYDKVMTTTNAQTSIRTRVWEATENENTMYLATYVPRSGKNKGRETQLTFMGRQKVLVIWLRDTTVQIDGSIYKREKIGTYWDGLSWINVTKEGATPFPNGKKPIAMIQRMLNLCTDPNDDAIVLDFFAGSASTAHAVLSQNMEDGGRRRFIMVQLPEKCDSKSDAFKDGFETVAELGKERLRRSISKIREESPEVEHDLGFRVVKLDASNLISWDAEFDTLDQSLLESGQSIKPERGEADVLYELLLKFGLDISIQIEEIDIATKKVFVIGAGALIACLADELTLDVVQDIADIVDKLQPEIARVVFKDSGFADDVVKTNAIQILRQRGIEDVKSL